MHELSTNKYINIKGIFHITSSESAKVVTSESGLVIWNKTSK